MTAPDSFLLRSPYLQCLLVQLLPKLRAWPVREWPGVLTKAREAEFDQFERIGIVAAVVLSACILQPWQGSDASISFVIFQQWLLAFPLLVLLAGPFFLRRIRRELEAAARELQAQHLDENEANRHRNG